MSYSSPTTASCPPTMLHGLAPGTVSPGDEVLLQFLYAFLPKPPVSTSPSLRCAAAAAANKADRVSRLPDHLLRRVVSLLPAKDGARPLALRPDRPRRHPPPPPGRRAASPRPGRPRLARRHRRRLRRPRVASWALPLRQPHLQLHGRRRPRAARALVPAPCHQGRRGARLRQPPLAPPRPAPPFLALQLRLPLPPLHRRLGGWVFPDTASLPRGAAFPNLQQLVLGCVAMEDKDLEFVLAVSPVLEILTVTGSMSPLRARVTSHSLRCGQFCLSILEEVAVVDAPSLERFFLWRNWNEFQSKISTTVKIGHVPKLRVLGYLEPGVHLLQIGNTIIKAGTKASTHTTVPSVQMLAVQLQFGVRSEVKMLPSFLRCFPSVETLVVESRVVREPASSLSLKIWQETGPIECVQSHLKILSFHEVQGNRNEFDFLTFVAENAPNLERMFIVIKNDLTYAERQVVAAGVGALYSANWASRDCKVQYLISCYPIGGGSWSLQAGSDLSVDDPFEAYPED